MRGIKGGVRGNQRAKEGVAILMSERMWSLVVEYKVVSSRIVWVSRAYAVCWVTPNFWENALTDEKKKKLLFNVNFC